MAAILGSPVAISWAAGANPAGQSVTVPSGATAVYFFWSFFPGSLGQGLASVTLGGNAPSQTFEVASLDAEPAAGVAVWYNPSSGSQTLDPAWDVAPGDGPNTIVVFVDDSNTTSWRDADGDAGNGAGAVTVTLTTVATDLVIKWDSRFAATPPALSASWTNAQTQTNVGGYSSRVSTIVAAGTTQVADGENESYSGLIAISIPDAAGGGGTVFTEILTDTASITDALSPFAHRNRRLDDSIEVTEGGTIRSVSTNLLADDALDVTDSGTQFSIRGRVGTDTIDISDQAFWFILRHRLLQSGINLTDELISATSGSNVLTRVLTSEILLADQALPYAYRNRLLESGIEATDEAALWVIRHRLLESGISLTDEALSQVFGGNILFRVLTSEIVTADELLKALLISRSMSDAIDIDDSLLTAMQRFILLTDAISVDDSLLSSDTTPVPVTPLIRIGFDQPRIELGGYGL